MESVWTQKAWNLININGKLLSLPALFFFPTSQFLHQHFSSSFKNFLKWKKKKKKNKHATIFFSFCQYPQSLMDSCFIHIIFVLLLLFEWEIWTFFLLCNICYGISSTNLMVFCILKKKKHQICHHICASKLLWSRLINLFTNDIQIYWEPLHVRYLQFVFPTLHFGYTIKKFG
jgi:hypothetical protein